AKHLIGHTTWQNVGKAALLVALRFTGSRLLGTAQKLVEKLVQAHVDFSPQCVSGPEVVSQKRNSK
ncbi:MAG: hypothetical protein HRU27_05590, partial [Rhizobiaceae bacterium]|nr:hypothetical protein [Rhizobiaceae bacterium]